MHIGLIGTDSSHAFAFSRLLIEKGHRITAFQGGSTITMSRERIGKFTAQLTDLHVPFVETIEELVVRCDAFIITSVDDRQHLGQFQQIVHVRKPVFIDKPIAPTVEDVAIMIALAAQHETPLFSSSALRFANEVQHAQKSIRAVDLFVPLPMLQPFDYFYYGIHALEMLDTLLPLDVEAVDVNICEREHYMQLFYRSGHISTIRGSLQAREQFQFVTHSEQESVLHTIAAADFSFYNRLVDAIEHFFITKESPVPIGRTKQIIALLEALEKSAMRGQRQLTH